MSYTLNIGLARNDGLPDNTLGETLQALSNARLIKHIVTLRVAQSATEQTLIVKLRVAEVFKSKINLLCELLAQDCIALRGGATNAGSLQGPNAAKWGEFNPDFFLE